MDSLAFLYSRSIKLLKTFTFTSQVRYIYIWKGIQSGWLSLCPVQGRELVQLVVDLKVPETRISALAVEEVLGLERLSV